MGMWVNEGIQATNVIVDRQREITQQHPDSLYKKGVGSSVTIPSKVCLVHSF